MAIAQRRRPRNLVSRVVCVVTLGVLVLVASPAGAHITRIQITAKESPTFGGYSWPGVGQYEKIVACLSETETWDQLHFYGTNVVTGDVVSLRVGPKTYRKPELKKLGLLRKLTRMSW